MAFPKLNFPEINVRLRKNAKNTIQLFDIIRKKFVDLTPEEWVRQHVIHYLVSYKEFPVSMVSVEKQLILNNTKRRTDILVFDTELKPLLIVECKSPDIEINQLTINQVLRYNLELNVPFVFLSNGNTHILLKFNNNEPEILREIPIYKDLV